VRLSLHIICHPERSADRGPQSAVVGAMGWERSRLTNLCHPERSEVEGSAFIQPQGLGVVTDHSPKPPDLRTPCESARKGEFRYHLRVINLERR
jgi:hypothetical protein